MPDAAAARAADPPLYAIEAAACMEAATNQTLRQSTRGGCGRYRAFASLHRLVSSHSGGSPSACDARAAKGTLERAVQGPVAGGDASAGANGARWGGSWPRRTSEASALALAIALAVVPDPSGAPERQSRARSGELFVRPAPNIIRRRR